MVVGWRILYLTRCGRQTPEAPCGVYFLEHEWKALLWYEKGTTPTDAQQPSLRTFTHMIAKLGGFPGRNSDGDPGCQTLWRGWQRLKDIIACYLLATHQIHDFVHSVPCLCGSG